MREPAMIAGNYCTGIEFAPLRCSQRHSENECNTAKPRQPIDDKPRQFHWLDDAN
jgi:hypothetical protein